MKAAPRELLVVFGAAVVLYAIAILEFVAVSPDLRIRAFLVDASRGEYQDGIVVREAPALRVKGGQTSIQPGDTLISVGRRPTPTLLDFFEAKDRLRSVDAQEVSLVGPGDPSDKFTPDHVKGIVDEVDGYKQSPVRRLVEIQFRPAVGGPLRTCWVEVQSPPARELGLTFLWLLPHLGILLVGAAAVWQRPFDRAARLFYVMSVITLGAYVGGFHWWIVSSSTWLLFPFIVFGIVLPAVTLHFFLVFPRPVGWAVSHPRTLLFLIYALPTVAVAGAAAFLIYAEAFAPTSESVASPEAVRQKLAVLSGVRIGIDVYLGFAALYYGVTLGALVRSLRTVHEPTERAQVLWILAAAIVATLPVGYTLILAATDRAAFAFGGARFPMLIADFGFLSAYAVGMVRYRLLLADEVVGKGLRYYLSRIGVTLVLACVLAALGLWAGAWGEWTRRPQAAAAVMGVIALAMFILLAARDRIQEEIDRRFFSEKYQLGATLRGMHLAADHVADEGDLAGRVLDSCREVLDISRGAIYRKSDAGNDQYRLAAALGDGFPEEMPIEPAVVRAIADGGSVQRVLTGSRIELSSVQSLLRRLSAQLLYAPPSGRGGTTLLLLGAKPNDAAYTAEDLTFLSAIGHVADVALDAAGAQQTHRRLAEQVRSAEETLAAQSRQVAGQVRQIAVLQAELAELHRRQGAATPSTGDEEFRRDLIRGDSPAISRVLETVRKVAGSDATVMIRGESGTGKELLAQVLHDNSPRRNGPMIRVHCAALSPTLLESELFGHVKGAFTGADRDKTGRFQMADGGTLFLDEIGDISPEVQVKLLRVLQERCFEPVGSGKTVAVDVRLITATNRDLEQMIADAEFREDLYYRLNVISVTLPPLRERKEDVYDLAFTFLHRAARRLGKPVTRIDDTALAVLSRYQWPGNVRELQNVIERAVVLSDGDAVTLGDLPAELSPLRPASSPPVKALPGPAPPARPGRRPAARPKPAAVGRRVVVSASDESERDQLIAALRDASGNKAEAARLLGLPRSTFFSKLKKHDLG